MKKFLIVTAISILISTNASAENKACETTVNVKVNGLVCDFCARALEKVFGKKEQVASTHVDLTKGEVVLKLKGGQMPDDEIKTAITDAGYNVTDIKRTECK